MYSYQRFNCIYDVDTFHMVSRVSQARYCYFRFAHGVQHIYHSRFKLTVCQKLQLDVKWNLPWSWCVFYRFGLYVLYTDCVDQATVCIKWSLPRGRFCDLAASQVFYMHRRKALIMRSLHHHQQNRLVEGVLQIFDPKPFWFPVAMLEALIPTDCPF